jgi:hypothetical protein
MFRIRLLDAGLGVMAPYEFNGVDEKSLILGINYKLYVNNYSVFDQKYNYLIYNLWMFSEFDTV